MPHAPGLYTSGKLTLATGYKPPDDHPDREQIVPVTASTDSGLALKSRKGTGFYKIFSLRGVWYRPDHVPGGWKGQDGAVRGIPGHPFGLRLKAKEISDLLEFLRSL